MFTFFTDVKTRLTALEQKVEAIFTNIHTDLATKVAGEVAAVEAEPKQVVAEVAADIENKV